MERIKEMLKKVNRIELITKKPAEGLISGSYHSVFKGRGIEFSEVREYIPGDDIRSIDWNVTARFNKPYIKEFVEERDIDVYIAIDISRSNEFGWKRQKKEVIWEIASSLMFAALKNNDNIGLCLFSERIEKFIKAGKGKKLFLRLLREMIYHQPRYAMTDINQPLSQLYRILKKRSIIFVISDFICKGFEKSLKLLKNRHDVILIKVTDPRERKIPESGYILLEDEETGEQLLINISSQTAKDFQRKREREEKDFEKKMKKLGVDVISVSTEEDFYIPIKRFFKMRRMRR